jgi:hypothetical protein
LTWRGRFAEIDKRALLSSLVAAALAFAAFALIIDRLTRLAKAAPLGSDAKWEARLGEELQLNGLKQGPVLAIETGAGDAMTVRAGPVRLDDGSTVSELIWMVSRASGEVEGDHKASLRLSTIADGGDVILRRGGEEVVPQLQVGAARMPLKVETGVAIGDTMVMPSITILADGREVQPLGMGTVFTVQPGGSLAIEFRALPDGTPAGVTTVLGVNDVADSRREGWRLEMTEAALAGENRGAARMFACAAPAGSYAAGGDCKRGYLFAHQFGISRDAVSLDLRGSAFLLVDGRPTASLWSWAMANPVLEAAANEVVPGMISLLLGWVTFRQTARPKPKAAKKPGTRAPKAKRKPPAGPRARG